jgi:uncharacterized protein (DUF983 family)
MLDAEYGTRFSSDHKCEACGLEYWFGLAIKTPLHTQEWLVTIGPPAECIKVSCPKCGQGEVFHYEEETE